MGTAAIETSVPLPPGSYPANVSVAMIRKTMIGKDLIRSQNIGPDMNLLTGQPTYFQSLTLRFRKSLSWPVNNTQNRTLSSPHFQPLNSRRTPRSQGCRGTC
ncbi:hypothetical protein SBA4_1510008 [Candidatus Sulfopaludibacter sp. SbA4]|nr:hypothetical protein SBA4_1510008 [Candidatus Sulfopaludibacter sp. SbA4]